MKNIFTALCLSSLSIASFAQAPVAENLRILIKDTSTVSRALKGDYINTALEVGMSKKYTELKKINFPIRVALDPGHVATNKKEAIVESRFIRTKKGFFYESNLTMATAKLVKAKLEEKGYEVMITRPEGKSALGVTFTEWYKKQFRSQLKKDLENGKINKERYQFLLHADRATVFHQYFRDLDFLARGAAINAFNADIAIAIHYNATEFDNRPDTFAPEVDYNYSVAFVPGSFTNQELSLQGQMEDFIRLASSNTIEKSIELSNYLIEEFHSKLGAKPLLPNDIPDLWYLKKYSTYTGRPGIYGRNLYLTRAIKCPSSYTECFLQNNSSEIVRLTEKNLKVGKLKVSSRVADVADCIYAAIVKYFNNSAITQK